MSKSDKKFINLSEDYELNYILKKYNKAQNKANRDMLIKIINDAKKNNPEIKDITHSMIDSILKDKLDNFE